MKLLRRLLLVIAILFILLIGAAFAIPYFFKDELLALTKEEINKTINAKVDFEDVSLSLFRSFPNLSFELQNFSVVGVETFEDITLAAGKSAGFTLDLMSVVRSGEPIEIKSVDLEAPEVNIYVLKDGTANYDIAKPSTDTTSTEESGDYSNVVGTTKRISNFRCCHII